MVVLINPVEDDRYVRKEFGDNIKGTCLAYLAFILLL